MRRTAIGSNASFLFTFRNLTDHEVFATDKSACNDAFAIRVAHALYRLTIRREKNLLPAELGGRQVSLHPAHGGILESRELDLL